MISIKQREQIRDEYLQGLENNILNIFEQFPSLVDVQDEIKNKYKKILTNIEVLEPLISEKEEYRLLVLSLMKITLSLAEHYHFLNNPKLEDATSLNGSSCISYEDVFNDLEKMSVFARLQILEQLHDAEKYDLLSDALINLNKESFLELKDTGLLSPLQYIFGTRRQMEEASALSFNDIDINNVDEVDTHIKEVNRRFSLLNSNQELPPFEMIMNPKETVGYIDKILNEIDTYPKWEKYIISKYLDKPIFQYVYKYYAQASGKTGETGLSNDVTSSFIEINEEMNKMIFNFAPGDSCTELYPESSYAFDGSKGLAEYLINNKKKFELFIHLLANQFHYIPNNKSQAKAFVRTITGIKCDGGKIRPTLQSTDAVKAILYMAQRRILSGEIKEALQKFDFKEGVVHEHKGDWHSRYAKNADLQFKRVVGDVFGSYKGFKLDKK